MDIKIDLNPSLGTVQTVMYFLFRFMGWSKEDMVDQNDRYGTVPFAYVLAYKNNELVGTILLHKRDITINGKVVKLGGIGGVCVHDDYRRQGIALALLTAAMQVLTNQGLDIAFLTTDLATLEGLYSKVGFAPLGRNYKATGLSGKEYFDEGGMIAVLNSIEVFQDIMKSQEIFDLQGQDW